MSSPDNVIELGERLKRVLVAFESAADAVRVNFTPPSHGGATFMLRVCAPGASSHYLNIGDVYGRTEGAACRRAWRLIVRKLERRLARAARKYHPAEAAVRAARSYA